jgi:hypothetical protein
MLFFKTKVAAMANGSSRRTESGGKQKKVQGSELCFANLAENTPFASPAPQIA